MQGARGLVGVFFILGEDVDVAGLVLHRCLGASRFAVNTQRGLHSRSGCPGLGFRV